MLRYYFFLIQFNIFPLKSSTALNFTIRPIYKIIEQHKYCGNVYELFTTNDLLIGSLTPRFTKPTVRITNVACCQYTLALLNQSIFSPSPRLPYSSPHIYRTSSLWASSLGTLMCTSLSVMILRICKGRGLDYGRSQLLIFLQSSIGHLFTFGIKAFVRPRSGFESRE